MFQTQQIGFFLSDKFSESGPVLTDLSSIALALVMQKMGSLPILSDVH